MKLNKEVRLELLEAEMVAAGVAIRALGTAGDEVFTYSETGAPKELPLEAQAVIASHVPDPAVDPRVAKIDGMDISFGDKAILKELLGIR